MTAAEKQTMREVPIPGTYTGFLKRLAECAEIDMKLVDRAVNTENDRSFNCTTDYGTVVFVYRYGDLKFYGPLTKFRTEGLPVRSVAAMLECISGRKEQRERDYH